MTGNKIVIRRLPPTLCEDELLAQLGPLPDHDYFCFFEAAPNLGCHSFSRAYINFSNSEDKLAFRDKFDNYVFKDRNGREYPAVVEESFWNKSATSGPFYKTVGIEIPLQNQTSSMTATSQGVSDMEKDEDYLEFVGRLLDQRNKSHQPPTQTIERNLDELTNASASGQPGKKGGQKVSTPLLEYINKKRSSTKQVRKTK